MGIKFTPQPPDDTADDCIKHGWRYIEDITGGEVFQRMSTENLAEALGRIAEKGFHGDPTAVYIPDGIFYSAAQTAEDGRWMLLPILAVIDSKVSISRA